MSEPSEMKHNLSWYTYTKPVSCSNDCAAIECYTFPPCS